MDLTDRTIELVSGPHGEVKLGRTCAQGVERPPPPAISTATHTEKPSPNKDSTPTNRQSQSVHRTAQSADEEATAARRARVGLNTLGREREFNTGFATHHMKLGSQANKRAPFVETSANSVEVCAREMINNNSQGHLRRDPMA